MAKIEEKLPEKIAIGNTENDVKLNVNETGGNILTKPDVSIIITAYNVGEYIKTAVLSALNQTFKNLEVVVVIDKPTDNTLDVLMDIADKTKDKRLRLIQNEENVGTGLSRRIGLQNSIGKYTLLLDGDDWLEPDFIESLYNKAVETKADIVSGGIVVRRENGAYDATSYGECETFGTDKVLKFWGERIVFMNNKLIERHLHDLIPYCHRRYIEDTPVIVPQLHLANKVVYVDNIGYNYRMREGSLTHESNAFKNALYRALCWFDLIEFFNNNGKEMFKVLDFRRNLNKELKILQSIDITNEMIKPYLVDWLEYSRRLLKFL